MGSAPARPLGRRSWSSAARRFGGHDHASAGHAGRKSDTFGEKGATPGRLCRRPAATAPGGLEEVWMSTMQPERWRDLKAKLEAAGVAYAEVGGCDTVGDMYCRPVS
jgi:hypothetical protein